MMKGRKLLSLALCAALTLGLAAPALAAEAADQALMAVTAKVKETLELDTEVYTDFHGESFEDVLLGKRWRLEWTGDGVSLSVTADDAGKVYAYSARRDTEDLPVAARGNGGRLNIPQLPQDKSQAAFETAKDFLGKVLDKELERVELTNDYRPSLRQDTYRYSGSILLNGLESPISCSVTVRAGDLTVLRFDRDDQSSGYLGGVPSPNTAVTDAAARRLLRSTLKLEPKYVLQDDGKTARVQYVPQATHDFYVDGVSGQLIDLTELREKLWRSGSAGGAFNREFAADSAAPEAAMKNAALTQAEKDGAAILREALAKEELDRVLKNAWPELGLDKYTLATATYSVQERELAQGAERTPDDYDITCRLTYGRQLDQATANKYITVDAKTGTLKSLHSGRSYKEGWPEEFPVNTTQTVAQNTAQSFLRAFAGTHYDQLALFSSQDAKAEKDWEHTFTFQQTANGYFFDGNAYTVGVDAADGTISTLYGSFDEKVELVKPAKVVSLDVALDAYVEAMTLRYGYLEVPVSISLAGPQIAPLLKEAGYDYVYALKTGFVLTQPKNAYVEGVDAETGAAVKRDYTPGQETSITYDDVQGHWVQSAAEALALFQVGFPGGSLKPAETLTQRDMLVLLLSVEGYTFNPENTEQKEVDGLYSIAYSYGLVTPETRNDNKAVTRGELVKTILDAAGYGKIAAIPGIFRCDYADASSIPAESQGYAALAQGLGLVRGGSDGAYAAGRTVDRASAVSMLYQYMK